MSERKIETPFIPVSWGEIIDKISILEIKFDRILDSDAQKNIRNELDALQPFEFNITNTQLQELKAELLSVNMSLWDVEEEIRKCEAKNKFDNEFINLARSVYFLNDERARIKRRINILTQSVLVEEKSYSSY